MYSITCYKTDSISNLTSSCRGCWGSSCWRLRVWLLRTPWWWWRVRATRTPRSASERLRSRATWSRRTSTPSGTRCMRCVWRLRCSNEAWFHIETQHSVSPVLLPQVVLRPQPGQEVQVELYDKDMDKDDFLGRWGLEDCFLISSLFLLDCKNLKCVWLLIFLFTGWKSVCQTSSTPSSQTRWVFNDYCRWCKHSTVFTRLWFNKHASVFQWYDLNDVKSGRVRLITEWVPTVSRSDALDQVCGLFVSLYFHI